MKRAEGACIAHVMQILDDGMCVYAPTPDNKLLSSQRHDRRTVHLGKENPKIGRSISNSDDCVLLWKLTMQNTSKTEIIETK